MKRRVQLLARLDGASVWLEDGLHVVSLDVAPDVDDLVARLRDRGTIDRRTLSAVGGSPLAVDTRLLATAHRDLRALATAPARSLAREHRKGLARYGDIDDAWIARKTARVEELARELASQPSSAWFDRVLEVTRAVHGRASAEALAEAALRLTALGAERRRRARDNVEALARGLEGEPVPHDLAPLAERLERSRDLPGRARRTRALDVLRKALGWPLAPADAARPFAEPRALADYPGTLRRVGAALARAMPADRDEKARGETLALLASAGLRYRVGDDGIPLLTEEDVALATKHAKNLEDLEGLDVTLAQALALAALPTSRYPRRRLARVVTKGLDLELVRRVAKEGELDRLVQASDDVRSARAFATWATKLVPHYKALGVSIELSPELFANLPRNEDLGVLAYCLVEADRKAPGDPMAVLDATLGLFQKLPARARGLLGRLRGTTPGAGRAAFPELAAWLESDDLLDRYVHLARLACVPVVLSKRVREDFEHADKSARERAHLLSLPSRSDRQEARLVALAARDRSLAATPRARTIRRIEERIEELFPLAYRRELDATYRAILDDAWGIRIPLLTPAWRDAVRFWLVIDENRELLGHLLRAAAASPGRDVTRRFPKNVTWIDEAPFRVDAWLRPRREVLEGGFVLELEEDPLEVLRMGMPFGTCLALDTGFNAASTVVNAVDANKRVLYVRTREGKVVARKLLAITPERTLVGYHLYVSIAGPEEARIREAVLRMCRTIAAETGLPLAAHGKEPARLHGDFWYDDGTVPFEGDVDVGAYCRALGLPPPAKPHNDLETEAKGQAAIGRGDVDAAIQALLTWDRGPANLRVGRWLVETLGRREAIRRSERSSELVPALLEAHDEDQMLAALELSTRLSERIAAHSIARALQSFPPSIRLADALVGAAERSIRGTETLHEGLPHLAFTALASRLVDVPHTLVLLDRVAPLWATMEERRPYCAQCRAAAEVEIHAALERFEPDDDAVLACLRSKRPSIVAHRAALHLAGQRGIEGGAAAVARVLVLRPELATTALAFAASVRQGLPPPRAGEPPFELLGPLALTPGLAVRVDRDVASFTPGKWELAYLRRNPDPALLAELFAIAARAPARVSRAMELLALLGATRELATLLARSRPNAEDIVAPQAITSRTECETVARGLRDQVAAAEAGKLVALGSMRLVDAGLADLARRKLEEGPRDRDLALETLTRAGYAWGPSWRRLAPNDVEALLGAVPPPRAFADVLGIASVPSLLAPLAHALARASDASWSLRAMAAERAGAAGLFEAWARALIETGAAERACGTDTVDQLRAVMRIAAADAPPKRAVELYAALPDTLSVAVFLRMLSPERLAAIRAAVPEREWQGEAEISRKAWLDSTSLQTRRSSSIELG